MRYDILASALNTDSFKKLTEFFSKQKKIHYKRREIILRPGDNPMGVFYLRKGFVRLYNISADGKELSLIIFKPEDIFPLMWAINNTSNNHYVEAMTAVELWRCPKNQFVSFLKENPEVFFTLMQGMLIRFDALLERMEQLVFGNAYQKIASIVYLCCERFGVLEGTNMVIPLSLTHRDIASLIGVTRETVSIEIKKLEKKKILEYRGRLVVVRDAKRLRRESLLTIEY
ncbi:MAG: Crp/Fnr family transcriptional regulator [Candidatus Levybacteria bacterium]|nr:Crp/Fnr family transcriptional regulator [Candidatus Levybacteria bacterium]